MEVSVSVLRSELKSWIERAKDGQPVIITDRGIPVARITGIESTDLITALQQEGVLTSPVKSRKQLDVESKQPRTENPVSGLVRRFRR